jgi:transcriptional regulator with PAS, ATPase and Fis domain
MIKVNCAAIPENLLESELFGYEKGAFTGAMATKPGRFELAHKETLFLDEVGELPKEMQVKTTPGNSGTVLRTGRGITYHRGRCAPDHGHEQNLQQDVRDGRFREDLFYRLNVLPIHLPALRERREDIPALVEFFLDKFNRKLDRHVLAWMKPLWTSSSSITGPVTSERWKI